MSIQKGINILFFIVVIFFSLYFYLKGDEVKVIEKTRIEYIPEVSKLPNTKPRKVELKTIKVPVVVPGATVTDTVYKDKEVKKYTYIDSLKNGVVTSTIISDHIYDRSVELKTSTKKITEYVVPNSLFINLESSHFFTGGMNDLEVSVDYTFKNKFRIGYSQGYNFVIKEPTYGFKIGIPLD